MRALHPTFAALGLPGITNWRSEWAKLVLDACGGTWQEDGSLEQKGSADSNMLRWTNSSITMRDASNDGAKGNTNVPFAFPWRICLDRGKPDQRGLVPEDMASSRIALDLAGRGQEREMVIGWWVSRHRRGRALGCVLCGAPEPWLCRGCGRRRAKGKDWAEDWASAR
jgi:hypothetical protein